MLIHMSAPVILGITAVVFGVIPLVLRSNAVYILMALLAGEELARLTAQPVTKTINAMIVVSWPVYTVVQIVMLVIMPLLLLVWYRKSVKADIVLHIAPLVAAVLLGFMLIIAKLPYDTQRTLQSSNIYDMVQPYFGISLAAAMVSAAVWFLFKRPKHGKHDKKKHHE